MREAPTTATVGSGGLRGAGRSSWGLVSAPAYPFSLQALSIPHGAASVETVFFFRPFLSALRGPGELLRLIREAGRQPVERGTLYRPVTRSDTTLTVLV